MGTQRAFSRRQMLAMSAAAANLAVGSGYRSAGAQAAKRIERLDPALDQIVSASEPIVDLATNLGGTANVEGPLWWKEGGYLLFRGTDLKRWKYAPGQGISVFKENTNAANGITRDMQGRLVACEAATRRVVREEHDGTITVLASSFQGRPLNFPNDIVVKSDGAIYFTDPWAGPRAQEPPGQSDLTFAGVFRISPDRGTLALLVDDFLTPNGIAFSPDERVLYVNDSQRRHIRARPLYPRSNRQETRPHRPWLWQHGQCRVWRRRLEDRVLLHPHKPGLFEGKDCRRTGAYGTEIVISRGAPEAWRAFAGGILKAKQQQRRSSAGKLVDCGHSRECLVAGSRSA